MSIKQLFLCTTCFTCLVLILIRPAKGEHPIDEINLNTCSEIVETSDYFVDQGRFQTLDDLIPPGCLAQLMTELNGDDSVAAIFLSRTKLRGCIDANYPYPGGDEEKIDYQIILKMKNHTYKVQVCQSVEGSLGESCSNVIMRFTKRSYWNEEIMLCVLSLEKLGEF